MFCRSCGRKYDTTCHCARSTTYTRWDYSFIISLLMLVPTYFLVQAFFVIGIQLPYFEQTLKGVIIVLLLLTVHDIVIKRSYLPLLFGCHQQVTRSIHIKNKPLLLCARCSGIYIGMLFSSVFIFIYIHPLFMLLLGIPLLIDGTLQQYTSYTSNNILRFITGFLFAPLLLYVFSLIHYGLFRSVIHILQII